MEELIYRGQGESHPIEVSDDGPLRYLRFGAEESQSCLHLERPHELQLAYTRWMMTALLFPPNPGRFLLCGLGGGAIAHFLHHHHPEARLDIIEKEEEVIRVADTFFKLPRGPRLQVLHADVVDHLCRTPQAPCYDVAFIDIFGPRSMAPPLFVPAFYHDLLQRLSPQGVLAVNLWNGELELFGRARRALAESCNHQLLQLAVKKRSNTILLAFPTTLPKDTIKRARKEIPLYQQRYRLPFHRYLKRLRRTNKLAAILAQAELFLP
ncbi:spermine/spermidine synthase domain-containing protein [Desulfogranum mediterraneum]|uniref:spermine/spermidine synthase domain-containing protein n=1 Tax=Desulfogranum mediterraneum TaxID=160661 RepID=UPI0004242630|nr:hypothetical protein [Desulfogranum mediterraneum]